MADSLEIRVVEHGPLSDRTAFRFEAPLYRVGWSSQGHLFERVEKGAWLSGGRAVVGDVGRSELVVLGPSGEVETVLGGEGEGPTEIAALSSITVLPGDTIVVEDDGNARMSFIHDDQWVRSYRVEGGMSTMATQALGRVDRTLISQPFMYVIYFPEPWLRTPIVRHSLDTQAFDTLGYYELARRVTRDVTPNPFRPHGQIGLTAGAILISRGDRPEVEFRDPGTGDTRQVVRWAEVPPPFSDSVWAIYEEHWRQRASNMPEAMRERDLAAARAASGGEPLPLIGRLLGDPLGRAWVSIYSARYRGRHPTRYRVFGPDGSWLGWVEAPPSTDILAIGIDRALAVQRDQFDVESVVVLPLVPVS